MKTKTAAKPRLREVQARYGPWAVVTGASDGIGRAFAERLATAGINVVLAARRSDKLAEVAHSLEAAHGVRTEVVAVDLGTREGVSRLVAATSKLDVGLFVAAAGYGTSGSFLDGEIEEELAMIDLNCRAVAELAHHYGRRFAEARRGGIVLLSSLVAFQGVPRAANYAATKAYTQSLAEGLRVELAPLGVDVMAVAPGPVHSGFAARANMRMGAADTPAVVARETVAALGRTGLVRPGWTSKLLSWSLATLPRWARVRIMAIVMGGMTKHQRSKSRGSADGARAPGSAHVVIVLALVTASMLLGSTRAGFLVGVPEGYGVSEPTTQGSLPRRLVIEPGKKIVNVDIRLRY